MQAVSHRQRAGNRECEKEYCGRSGNVAAVIRRALQYSHLGVRIAQGLSASACKENQNESLRSPMLDSAVRRRNRPPAAAPPLQRTPQTCHMMSYTVTYYMIDS